MRAMLGGMFVYYYALVERGLEHVKRRLEEIPARAGEWAHDAYRSGEHRAATMRVGPTAGPAKEVLIRVEPVVRTGDVVTMSLTWEATGVPRLFPRLEADLVAARVSDGETQVSLRGSYTPPLGPVGRALDRALFHRLAESTVKEFVDRIAAYTAAEIVRPLRTEGS